ncbi:MAG: hypothetical protein F6K11_25385 [Leptolyngbya sp. SIO3F4]|nr:hypothetical protein [Leptolyngbya sp. SIO3F4]
MKRIYLWSRVPLSQRHKLPSKSGLYAVVSCFRVMYIGKSTNLRQRWLGDRHHRLPQANDMVMPYLHYITLSEHKIHEVEQKLIKRVKPPWNNTKVPKHQWALDEVIAILLMIAMALSVFSYFGEPILNFIGSMGPFGR